MVDLDHLSLFQLLFDIQVVQILRRPLLIAEFDRWWVQWLQELAWWSVPNQERFLTLLNIHVLRWVSHLGHGGWLLLHAWEAFDRDEHAEHLTACYFPLYKEYGTDALCVCVPKSLEELHRLIPQSGWLPILTDPVGWKDLNHWLWLQLLDCLLEDINLCLYSTVMDPDYMLTQLLLW